MKVFDHITLRAFCRATEDLEKVVMALMFAAGTDDKEDVLITELEGYGGSPLKMLEVRLSRQKEILAFWKSLPEDVLSRLLKELEERVDEEQVLHFRLDKERAYMGDISLISRGAVISVDAKILSYPANRDAAVSNAGEFLQNVLNQRK